MVDDTANTNDISNTVSTLTTNEKGADCDSPTAATATAINVNTNTTASRQLCITIWKWCTKFYSQNSLLILILISILLAYAYPPLGATYLAPQVTAKWIAVIIIFILSGLSLQTRELINAFKRLKFNLFVQIYNFGVISAISYGFSRAMRSIGAISSSLADGIVICSCLPMTINMVIVLTKSSSGDEAAAVFNAAFGNTIGIFLTPLLVLLYLGRSSSIDLGQVFLNLVLRVVLPLLIGQLLQLYSPPVVALVKKYKPKFKMLTEYCLVFIVYTVFCKTFQDKRDTSTKDIFVMIALQLILLTFVMVLAWGLLFLLFRDEPKLRVMGLFGCSHKSMAVGVPLINAMYEKDPLIGFYTLPLLIWHPLQLVLGSALSSRLSAFVSREQIRIEATGRDDFTREELAECGDEVKSNE